jgi:hypothetical protein
MNDDFNPAPQIIIFIAFIVTFAAGMVYGSKLSEHGNINIGRIQGIMLCSEKPDQCKVEYQYLKLKENQK